MENKLLSGDQLKVGMVVISVGESKTFLITRECVPGEQCGYYEDSTYRVNGSGYFDQYWTGLKVLGQVDKNLMELLGY